MERVALKLCVWRRVGYLSVILFTMTAFASQLTPELAKEVGDWKASTLFAAITIISMYFSFRTWKDYTKLQETFLKQQAEQVLATRELINEQRETNRKIASGICGYNNHATSKT